MACFSLSFFRSDQWLITDLFTTVHDAIYRSSVIPFLKVRKHNLRSRLSDVTLTKLLWVDVHLHGSKSEVAKDEEAERIAEGDVAPFEPFHKCIIKFQRDVPITASMEQLRHASLKQCNNRMQRKILQL
ncbi:unnamed protein product [Sphenostylis stenocarpa]|uniref:Uncharacterized protein n=1 Tax=Sphenostylis stenocarpa TaxID=92480 RepID=A0AA86SRK4_9FABA|nr:unnamed protein product [Sphenostylis stenocarpa]